ncbi:NusG domain II-containing protein [uncultured Clostridium sp.]|uniref:NusG domain II-containing protein n=1 Tax=uncultured Clostridium sp. TaxID=59620 RepID=UPI0028EB1CC3|nr:NusG domain II-containing protein [uncultured Clostridium sp.]
MKKWDVIIIAALIIISLIPEGVMFITNSNKYNSSYVEVYSQGKLYKKLPLNEDSGKTSLTIDNELGENVIEINNEQVKIIDADCPDKICVKAHAISKPGESLICLPHKLVVRIIGEGKQETDEVSF